MKNLSSSDVNLILAAASLATHAPEQMHANHLPGRLEELAGRLASMLAPAPVPVETAAGLG